MTPTDPSNGSSSAGRPPLTGRRRLVRPGGSTPKPPPAPVVPSASSYPAEWDRDSSTDKEIKGGISLDEWTQMVARAIPDVGEMAYKMQIAIAKAYLLEVRAYFESGAADFDRISNLRRAISGYDHPPMHDLWRRLVIKPAQRRRGYRRADPSAGIKGSPGVFAKGWGPCKILWQDEKWAEIALRLERGSFFHVPSEVRRKVFKLAMLNLGPRQFKVMVESMKHGSPYWTLPARPFSHIFSSEKMQARAREIGEQVMAGTYKPPIDEAQPSRPAWLDDPRYKEDNSSEREVSYDDTQTSWDALVEAGESTTGGGRHIGSKGRSE